MARPGLHTASDLLTAGLIAAERAEDVRRVGETYAIAVTPAIASLIDTADPHDPIALQFIPDGRELARLPEERDDPIGDHAKSPVRGIVHRYPDRVLLKIVGVCPVYCRFCFRREMVGPKAEANLTAGEIDAALAYVAAHQEIWEVIVTGGDPFVLSPRRVADLMARLDQIAHVKIVRWHTRVPVAAPDLVTEAFVAELASARTAAWVAIHVNHPRELSADALAAIRRLAAAGIPLLSQTVLLRGINDTVETLEALMRALVEAGVRPYYLHHADLAPGTSHFRTSIGEGQALVAALRQRVSGLAMPAYVLDIPGGFGKVPAGPQYISPDGGVSDPSGRHHDYP